VIHERPHARVVTMPHPGDRIARLTERERVVLREVCVYGGAEAAYRLCRSYDTVRNQLSSVYRKLGIAGGAPNKGSRACYLLGRDDERRERE